MEETLVIVEYKGTRASAMEYCIPRGSLDALLDRGKERKKLIDLLS